MDSDAPYAEQEPRPGWGVTTKAIVAVLLLVLAAIAFYAFRVVLVPLIIGTIMAAVFYPAAHKVSQWTRLPHGLATVLVYLILIVLVIPVALLLAPKVAEQIQAAQAQVVAIIQDLEEFSADTVEVLGYSFAVRDVVGEVTSSLTSTVTRAATTSIGFVMGAARTGFLAVVTLVIGLYLTRDAAKIVAWATRRVPLEYRDDFRRLLSDIYTVWSSFFRGQLILSLTVAVILGTVSAILGLPQPILLGIWGGLLEFLPSIGTIIWGATAILLAILRGSSYLPLPPFAFVLVVIGVYVAFAQLDINVLIPNIIGGSIRLHPIVVLLGVIVGMQIGGVLGIALAAPTIASLRVVGRYIYGMLFDLEPFPQEKAKT
jgi:predicted PurR-regulated permease PerM